jgi:hypothetical protein
VKGWKWARELRVQIGIIAAAFDHPDGFAVAVLFNALLGRDRAEGEGEMTGNRSFWQDDH